MSKYGTYKVVNGKVVQVREAKPYEPEAMKLPEKKDCHCAFCEFDKFLGEIAETQATANVAPVVEPEPEKLYTGVYL